MMVNAEQSHTDWLTRKEEGKRMYLNTHTHTGGEKEKDRANQKIPLNRTDLLPSSQLSPLYPVLQAQMPMIQMPCPPQWMSMHWLLGTSHSVPFQPLKHRQRPLEYWPLPLHSTGHEAAMGHRGTMLVYTACMCINTHTSIHIIQCAHSHMHGNIVS
jgi:hypothetical protein